MSSVLKYLLQMPDDCTNPTLQSTLNRSSKDKFILVLNLPYVLKKLSTKDPTFADLESIQMSVFGAIVPDVTVPAIQVPYGGQVINVSSHTRPNYAPLTINIVIDNTGTNIQATDSVSNLSGVNISPPYVAVFYYIAF